MLYQATSHTSGCRTRPPALYEIRAAIPRLSAVLQVRAFTKKTGAKPDFGDPVVLSADRGGTTVQHLCDQLHKSLAKEFKYALVWGSSTKHNPQR